MILTYKVALSEWRESNPLRTRQGAPIAVRDTTHSFRKSFLLGNVSHSGRIETERINTLPTYYCFPYNGHTAI